MIAIIGNKAEMHLTSMRGRPYQLLIYEELSFRRTDLGINRKEEFRNFQLVLLWG